ncbi:RNA polymerase sigma factor [Hahella aquimaris]|uniref:RNA polymerase sigma factor n=1 Tax=Hahella sp. HNIBRBA332 TaxID=3015983 RepID=UPI00273C74C4|nr:RNA polymerase sigma factor [Hahella sp. HNIBRBA332]WLQ14364.1 RNA polymerase sigma factor [Hahella sp. HNIBRBA332]
MAFNKLREKAEVPQQEENAKLSARQQIEAVYRAESRRILATLIRLLGDFDLAEEAMHEAFAAATDQWEQEGVPANPRAWLVSTGRFKAIDHLRRRARFDASLTDIAERLYAEATDAEDKQNEDIEDDRLRLIFTCCHPSLSTEAQVALTLREICDLTTEEIARAFLSSASTVAQRIVRAKSKIRDARIPYEVPTESELPERLESVLHVIYLVFNEGYSASAGDSLTRSDLSAEAIRLGRLLVELLKSKAEASEAMGLLALMLLSDSRRAARANAQGDLILLDAQDRSLWNKTQIEEGVQWITKALRDQRFGPYSLQAAISAVHAEAPSAEATDWSEIIGLYTLLLRINPSPVVALNRAVAVAMRDGPQRGLEIIDSIFAQGELHSYHLAHSAKADMHRRLGQFEEAREAYQQALTLAKQEPERRFLERRLEELDLSLKDV